MIEELAVTSIPTLSVDIPSGWSVDEVNIDATTFTPEAVISLTAPKLCMQGFKGKGGIPPPAFPGFPPAPSPLVPPPLPVPPNLPGSQTAQITPELMAEFMAWQQAKQANPKPPGP